MANVKKKKVVPSDAVIFGRVKAQLGIIGDSLIIANVVNHILNKRLSDDLDEALEIYADTQEKIKILIELGFTSGNPIG